MEEMLAVSDLWLMFALGLRHGFDPDHIAIIDSMAYRILPQRARLAPWVGTLFALGHGFAVTLIAVVLGAFSGGIAPPRSMQALLEWMPTILLIAVGSLNLRDLLGGSAFQVKGWKTRFMPRRLRDSSHPLAIVVVGVLFALVFDTATQAAAWGYAATARAGSSMALAAGLVFTAGMVLTDTVDGRLMVRLLSHSMSRADATTYRRCVGWCVVLVSYAMALYEIATRARLGTELDDVIITVIGCGLFLAVLFAYGFERRRPRAVSSLTQDQA